MKGIRTVLSMGMAFVVSAAALAFAGCSKKEEELSYTRAAYQKYLAYAEAIGDEPQSYEDWLADLKGEKGDKGEDGAPGKDGAQGKDGAPGKDGEDGTIWYTGLAADRESNTKARPGDFYLETYTFDFSLKTEDSWNKLGSLQGQAGNHIYSGSGNPGTYPDAVEGDIYINFSTGDVYVHNGTAFIKNSNYNIKGPPGNPGTNGTNGAAWFTSEGSPATAGIAGVDGDFCLDTKNGAIYQKKAGTWQLICVLQSAGSSVAGEELSPILEGTTAEVPDSGEGWYKVLLKTGEAALTEDQIKSLRVKITYCTGTTMPAYCNSRFELSAESTENNNIYFAVVPKLFFMDKTTQVDMDPNKEKKVEITGVTGDIKGKIEIKKWEPATVSSFGQEFDFFYVPNGAARSNKLYPKFVEVYAEKYGDTSILATNTTAGCHGSAFFFDQSLYPEISGAKLKLEYGADAFSNVNKFPKFSGGVAKYDVFAWVGSKNDQHNYDRVHDSWEFLATDGFTYLTIDDPQSNSDKYFFELCNTLSGSNKGVFLDYDSTTLGCVVPLKLKVTKAE